MGGTRGEHEGSPLLGRGFHRGAKSPWSWRGMGGSSKAPPSRDPDSGARGAGKAPEGEAWHRRSVQRRRFMGERPSSPRPAQEGSMPECAGMQGDATGGGTLPLPRLCCSTTHILQPFLSGNIWRT